jgi:hypothetical protein
MAMPESAQRSRLAREMVRERIGDYEQRNRESVNELAAALGCHEVVNDKEQSRMAAINAFGNLEDALQRGSKLTSAYSGELISVGWRNALLSDLGCGIVERGIPGLMLIAERSGTSVQLKALRADYTDEQILQALLRFTVWFRLLAAHRRGDPAGEVLWELVVKQLTGRLR